MPASPECLKCEGIEERSILPYTSCPEMALIKENITPIFKIIIGSEGCVIKVISQGLCEPQHAHQSIYTPDDSLHKSCHG